MLPFALLLALVFAFVSDFLRNFVLPAYAVIVVVVVAAAWIENEKKRKKQ